MPVFQTSQGVSVSHFHIGDPDFFDSDLDADGISAARAIVAGFASANEVDPPTLTFNCHGFTFTGAHAWFNRAKPFMDDDHTQISFEDAQKGDVISYVKGDRLKHSGIVEQVSGGQITKVRSKWGGMATVIHDLNDVPAAYGKPRVLRRPNN